VLMRLPASLRRGKRRASFRRHLHTGDKRAWSFDFDRGASVPGTVHAVNMQTKATLECVVPT